ncbi:hypothetical protein TNCV_2275381 [Trichonephila clavipes]|nr:hypothetical protein TNCV_2275381 [Trichonephila clavipes]
MANLGHQSLPPTNLGRVDEEMAHPRGGYPNYSNNVEVQDNSPSWQPQFCTDPPDGHIRNLIVTGDTQRTGIRIVLYQIQHNFLVVLNSYSLLTFLFARDGWSISGASMQGRGWAGNLLSE